MRSALLLFALTSACRSEAPVPAPAVDAQAPGGTLGQPSVLLIVVDTLRADRLGSYGGTAGNSPALDALAQDGVRFSNFFANSSWTRPSMASLLTGLHPRATGIHEERFDTLAPELTTLAERFSAAGYLSLGQTANPNLNTWFGFAQGFRDYGDSGVVWRWMDKDWGQERFSRGEHALEAADETTTHALELVQHHRAAMGTQPYFLQLVYIDPHHPYAPPPQHQQAAAAAGSPTPDYDGEVRHADAEIGRLLAALGGWGLLEDTLVVVTSDHGEGLTDHPGVPGAHRHGVSLFDSVLHVPLILSHPRLERGRVVDGLAAGIDLVPTLAELTGLSLEAELPGRSWAGVLKGEAAGPPRPVFAETDWRSNRKLAVRDLAWKLVRNLDAAAYRATGVHEGRSLERRELQHLRTVPDEALYAVGAEPGRTVEALDQSESQPEVKRELSTLLADFDREVTTRPPLNRDPKDGLTLQDGSFVAESEVEGAEGPDAATIERLKALGYLE